MLLKERKKGDTNLWAPPPAGGMQPAPQPCPGLLYSCLQPWAKHPTPHKPLGRTGSLR